MIPLAKPVIPFELVAEDFDKILSSGQLTSGPYLLAFEEQCADYVGVRHAVATTSATTAMHMVLSALDIAEGDEVLVSDFTFPATGNVVAQLGATPVLVDSREGGFDICVKDLARKVTAKSKAILVVHPFGQPADMDAIGRIAEAEGLQVIEDAACALGSRHASGAQCGALALAGCFSFHPRKLLTTGEGGMITTDDDALYEKLCVLRTHGGVRGDLGLRFVENGFNYRMSELQACLGLRQLPGFDAMLERRRALAQAYLDAFAGLQWVTVPMTGLLRDWSVQSFVCLLDERIDRNALAHKLREQGVETTLGTYAMHRHPAFEKFGYSDGDLPNSARSENSSLTLPLYDSLDARTIEHICGTLVDAVAAFQESA